MLTAGDRMLLERGRPSHRMTTDAYEEARRAMLLCCAGRAEVKLLTSLLYAVAPWQQVEEADERGAG